MKKGNHPTFQNSHQGYYENVDLWKKDLFESPDDKERILKTIAAVPEQVRSIIEVGCGNGAIVNNLVRLKKDLSRVVGVDISATALKHVDVEKYQGNINHLDFEANSFDCVIASEVIEHLTYFDFLQGIKEMQRVARKWILITVPNEDDLELDLRMCPRCYCWFNPNYHMNSFNKKKLHHLFDEFEVEYIKEIGPNIDGARYSDFAKLILCYHRHPPARIGTCPQCGFMSVESHKGAGEINPLLKKLGVLMDIFVKLIFTRKIGKRRWLLALYKRRE